MKPANILLSDYGEPELTDFGIARIAGAFQTATGVITGSPAFTAPEVLEGGAPTPASDVYSLGATLFCALTGHAAFERRSGEKVVTQFLRITSQPIPDLREQGFPADVAAMIERAMARDPADRPASAAVFGDELREIQRTAVWPSTRWPVPSNWAWSAEITGRVQARRGYRSPRRAPDTCDEVPPPRSDPIAGCPQPVIDVLRAGGRRRLSSSTRPRGSARARWRPSGARNSRATASRLAG